MKRSTWAWAWALSGCLFMGDAMAQGLRQPFSVRPAGFDYNRYLQEDAPSPSDQPAAEPAESAEPSPAPVVGSGACDSGCDGCGGCSSCGCGLGCLDCNLGDAYSVSSHLFCENSAWSVGGWTQIGYHDQSTGLFNNVPNQVNLHQQWVYLEKALDAECGWDWGFRTDFMYGIDSGDTNAFGNTVDAAGNPRGFDTGWQHGANYGFALPQLYAEVGYGDLSVKLGHFFTIIGYEVVPAPNNFFYSHAFTMYNNEPFTHTGALATYNVNDAVTLYGGWTLGWDTGFDQFQNGNNFLGGISYQLVDDLTIAYMTTIGDFGYRGSDGYMHSFVADANLTDNLNYVFQTDYLIVDSTGEDQYSVNQYLFYTVSDCVAVGGRAEWWKADPLNIALGVGNVSFYEATFGVNVRPHANLIFRPEVRQQWSPAANIDDTIFGIDMIATY